MNDLAYISGVLCGDGWCTQNLGLRVKDFDFSQSFSYAIKNVFNINLPPKKDERGYWLIRTSNKTGKFDFLKSFVPTCTEEYSSWVRGLFDSEGNACLRKNGISENSYGRRIAIYSTNIDTLSNAKNYLHNLGITTSINPTKNSISHKGTKVVYELRVLGNIKNYKLFSELVGSSIKRKQTILDAIPESYSKDDSFYRTAQLKGAESKRNNTLNKTLPVVLKNISEMINKGEKATQRACMKIPGYAAITHYYLHSEIIEMVQNISAE